ncbi:LemA family protein [Streptococcus suis]|uniref:LemA family protein n=1 Tax=Streptococcus suis TaxID=1307 RepID=UPI00145A05C2|nr:LemA family protein [Streptococcus suis]MBO4114089.1 LemA family protein [Streptococcus suis]
MKKRNILVELLKGIGLVLLSTILWTLILSFATPESSSGIYEPFPGFTVIAGILTSFILHIIMKYNQLRQAEQAAKASKSHIIVIEERNQALMEKANRLVEKHQNLEKETILDINKSVSKIRTVEEKTVMKSTKIESSQEFGQFLRQMPELMANKHIERLLNEIFETENNLAQWKISYNQQVEYFNTLLHQFPISIIAKIIRLKDLEFYKEHSLTDFTDEMLGL